MPAQEKNILCMRLDKIDKYILERLQADARLTTKALADELKLTTTPVFERIKKMEKAGIIDKYVALLKPKEVSLGLTVFISISLKGHTRSSLDKFVKEVDGFPEVAECFHVAGNFDFMLKVHVKDMDAYESFLLTKLSLISDLAQVQSYFVLSKRKYTTALPINLT